VKLVLSIVAAVGFGSIAGALWIAHRVSEPTVVSDPYEEGLHYDDHRHATDPTGGKRNARTPPEPGAPAGCDLQAGPCTRSVDGVGDVTLTVGPRPIRAMTDLAFTVRVSPPERAAGATPAIALSMPHMYMGETKVALAPTGDGAFQGKGVLVRCASGRRDWAVDVTLALPGDAPRTARFPLVAAE
jgi:hypothetical protein